MNSYKQQLNLVAQTLEYKQQTIKSQKRLREEEDQESQEKIMKKRQPKTLFRPWSDEQTTNQEAISSKKDTPSNVNHQQSKLALPTAAATPQLLPTHYQLAVQQQQQRQTALALQQAMYQRQLIMTQVWAQQRIQQHQQMMFHHQQQMRQQQMFAFGQQQGRK